MHDATPKIDQFTINVDELSTKNKKIEGDFETQKNGIKDLDDALTKRADRINKLIDEKYAAQRLANKIEREMQLAADDANDCRPGTDR